MKAGWLFAGVVIAALALGACGDDDDDDSDGSGGFAQGEFSAADKFAGAATPAAPASGGIPLSSGLGDEPLPQLDPGRKIIFTATLVLNSDDVGRSFSDASSLARSNGGYVEKSQYTNNSEDNERRSATLTIRVPVQNYDGLVASLRSMNGVTVDTEGSNSTEVTEQYTDLQSRQRNLERTEEQYLLLLNKATSIADILSVQDRLSGVRSQIEQIVGRLKVLDDLTDFATVNLSLTPVVAKVEESNGDWKLSEVFVESLEGSLEFARYVAAAGLIALAASPWIVVPGAVVYFGSRRMRRREAHATAPADGS